MTPEIAFYHKLMLQAGVSDRYDQHIDYILEKYDNFSDLILDLAFSLSDQSKTISLLYQYTLNYQVDIDIVASLVWEDLHERFVNKKCSLSKLREIMYRISVDSGHCFDEPWYTMGFFENCWDEVEIGLLDKYDFLKTMKEFLLKRTTITDDWIYKPQQLEVIL